MVPRRHEQHLNQPVRNKKDSKKEKKKEGKQVAVADVVQKPPEVSANVGNSPPNSVYAEVIAFAETDEAMFFKKKNCKILVSIGLKSSHMRPLARVFDTGAGQNFIRSDIIKPN